MKLAKSWNPPPPYILLTLPCITLTYIHTPPLLHDFISKNTKTNLRGRSYIVQNVTCWLPTEHRWVSPRWAHFHANYFIGDGWGGVEGGGRGWSHKYYCIVYVQNIYIQRRLHCYFHYELRNPFLRHYFSGQGVEPWDWRYNIVYRVCSSLL